MDSFGKKSVRFSEVFEEQKLRRQADRLRKENEIFSSTPKQNQQSFRPKPDNFKNPDTSMDSWDAFDAKMHKSKSSISKARNKFLELSSSQNKSLQLEDSDFPSYSFQDAKDIIEKDEKERMMFMNDNVSFSDSKADEGIDQVDPPSLLSFTSYFQQGSSFPESFLMAANSRNSDEPPERLRDLDSFSQQRASTLPQTSRRSSAKQTSFTSFNATAIDDERNRKAAKVSRKDSLTKFFLGPESDGMRREAIMDHVLDYCKRRASARLSVASSPSISPPENHKEDRHSVNNSKVSSRGDHDSGIDDDEVQLKLKSKSKSQRSTEEHKMVKPRDALDAILKEIQFEPMKTSTSTSSKTHVSSSKTLEQFDSNSFYSTSVQRAPVQSQKMNVSRSTPPDTISTFMNTSERPSKIPKHQQESSRSAQTTQFTQNQPTRVKEAPKTAQTYSSLPNNLVPSTKKSTSMDIPKSNQIVNGSGSDPQKSTKLPTDAPVRPSSVPSVSVNQQGVNPSSITHSSSNVPDSLQLVPAVQSALQHHHANMGNSQCSCHQHNNGQSYPGTPNMVPVPGMPIVIHIHLPCTMTQTGHPMVSAPTPTSENQKPN